MEKKTQLIAARVGPTIYAQIEQIAREEQRTISQVVGFALVDYLEKRKAGHE